MARATRRRWRRRAVLGEDGKLLPDWSIIAIVRASGGSRRRLLSFGDIRCGGSWKAPSASPAARRYATGYRCRTRSIRICQALLTLLHCTHIAAASQQQQRRRRQLSARSCCCCCCKKPPVSSFVVTPLTTASDRGQGTASGRRRLLGGWLTTDRDGWSPGKR